MDIRRHLAARAGARPRLGEAAGAGALLAALALAGAAFVMDAWPLEPLPYRLGQYVAGDLYARVPFEEHSPAKTAQQRDAAVRRTPAVLAPEEEAFDRLIGDVRDLPGRLKSATQPSQLDADIQKAFRLDKSEQLAAFAQYADPAKAADYNRQIDRLAQALRKYLIVTGKDYRAAFDAKDAEHVRLPGGKDDPLRAKNLLVNLENSRDLAGKLGQVSESVDAGIRENVLYYLQETIAAGAPLYRLNEEATRTAEQAARDAVPAVTDTVPAGRRLVPRSAEGGLTAGELALLTREHAAFLRQRNAEQPWARWQRLGGRAGMVLAVVALLGLYVVRCRPSLARNSGQSLATAGVLAAGLLLSKLTIGAGGQNPLLAVFGVFLAAAVLTIAYDQRFAFGLCGALVVLTGLQLRLGLGELMILWGSAAVAVFLLRQVRTRSKLIEAGGVVALAAFALAWSVGMARGAPARFVLVDACCAAGAAIVAGFIVQGILPVVERLFGVATSLTLLEWCDANKPMLKRLALEAPGTYNHSVVLGTLCEAAAEGIAARGLLARVGAYYHDIGKVNKPDYFIENRPGPGSRHDRLSPTMSLLVIKGHVRDGLQLARQYGLPRVLLEFIATHHGTTLVEYFFDAASRRQREQDQRAPREVEFRHVGPRPGSKEAAILLLADAAESSVRAMDQPSPGRIEAQVHSVVSRRLMDGQLDDCELTLKEVHAVEASLIASLCAFHHGRISYPRPVRLPRSTAAGPTGTAGR